MNDDPIIVTGASGTLGSAMVDHFKSLGLKCIPATRKGGSGSLRLDLENKDSWSLPNRIGSIVLAGAMTSQTDCRENRKRATLINLTRTVELAQIAAEAGAHVVFLSTNLVFDGKRPNYEPEDSLNPIGFYGELKAEAEIQLNARLGNNLCVVRLTKVFHKSLPILVKWNQQRMKGEAISAFTDLRVGPISIPYLKRAIEHLVRNRVHGTIHLSGDWDATYAEIAHFCLDCWNCGSMYRIEEIFSSVATLDAAPTHGTLGMISTEKQTGIKEDLSRTSLQQIVQALVQPV